MTRLAMSLAAGLLATAGAAQAQYGPGQYGPPPSPHGPGAYAPGPYNPGAFWRGAPENPWQRIRFLQDRVDRGIRDGSLDRREGARVNGELNGVRQWIRREHYMDAGRLTPDQRGRIQQRLDGISGQIRWLRHNGW